MYDLDKNRYIDELIAGYTITKDPHEDKSECERVTEIIRTELGNLSYARKGELLLIDEKDEDEADVAMIADAIDAEVNKGNVKTIGDMLDLMVTYVVNEAIHRKLASRVPA